MNSKDTKRNSKSSINKKEISGSAKRYKEMLSKVKKLMSKTKAKGASDAEAMSAMKKAQDIILKYKISEEELNDISEVKDEIVTSDALRSGSWTYYGSKEVIMVALQVASNLRCKAISVGSGKSKLIKFVGRSRDVELAVSTFIFAFDAAWYGVRRHAKATECKLTWVRESYFAGYCSGMREAFNKSLIEMRKKYATDEYSSKVGTSLMVIESALTVTPDAEVEEYVEDTTDGSKSTISVNVSDIYAYRQGHSDGVEFNSESDICSSQISTSAESNPYSEDTPYED